MPNSFNHDLFPGGGEMGQRIRAFDWEATPLGPPEEWPQNLKSAVTFCLGSAFPIVIWWDREHVTQLYNDAYISFLGPAKHPAFLGRPGSECWEEIWDTMKPLWDRVFETGEASWFEDFYYGINRRLPREEGYFTFSYSPIHGPAGTVDGIFCACYETTEKVVGARRLETLRRLGEQATEARSVVDACAQAVAVLHENLHDIPFVRIYHVDEQGNLPADTMAPAALGTALKSRSPVDVDNLELPGGAWPEPATRAVALPLLSLTQDKVTALIVLGVSPRRPLDSGYRTFFKLIAGHVSTAIANARAREEERRRAEALAEIDRAKTVFFSNVSHEFRTPLTLLLGPIEEALNDSRTIPENRSRMNVAHRNALRMLRLVNTLLDFSRIEAGRAQASYVSTDLAVFTADLASNFRSAMEKAGLRYTVRCEPLSEAAYIDRDMWEKIVLNLLSNAFKYTLEGEVALLLKEENGRAVLSVSDTGVGIPAEEQPRVFARFHRIEGVRGRTQEGSGIGLALVQELVKLHGGEVTLESESGKGSTFTVRMPLGREHLPAQQIDKRLPLSFASTAVKTEAFVGEALRWLPDAPSDEWAGFEVSEAAPHDPLTEGARIVIADDNADMRDYLQRLLRGHYRVETVPDGEAALAAIERDPPDLVLTDVMMPGIDGFDLLARLRADERTREIPILMLSARAGEDARIEGKQAGADDYLVKPFSARELTARINALLKIARLRHEWEQAIANSLREREAWEVGQKQALQLSLNGAPLEESLGVLVRTIVEHAGPQARAAFYLVGPDGTSLHHIVGMSPSYAREVDGFSIGSESIACGLAAYSGQPILTTDVRTDPRWEQWLWLAERFDYRGCWSFPIYTSAGKRVGTFAVYWREPHEATQRDLDFASLLTQTAAIIISQYQEGEERKKAEEDLRANEALLSAVYKQLPLGLGVMDMKGRWLRSNALMDRYVPSGIPSRTPETIKRWRGYDDQGNLIPPEDWPSARALRGETVIGMEMIYSEGEGAEQWMSISTAPLYDKSGRLIGATCAVVNVTERKRAEAALIDARNRADEANRAKSEFLANMSHEIRTPMNAVIGLSNILSLDTTLSATQKELVGTLQLSAQSLLELINDLLDMAKIETRKMNLEHIPFRFADVIGEVLGMLSVRAREKNIAIDYVRSPFDTREFLGDPLRIRQVLTNLVSNAVKFTESGRVTIGLNVSRQEEQGTVRADITIADTGIGIEPEKLEDIFEKFTQSDASTTRKYGGTGLGLAISKNLAEIMGGNITVKSDLGKGAEFRLHLPLNVVDESTLSLLVAEEPPKEAFPADARGCVLLVEDHKLNVVVASHLLKSLGYGCEVASDGKEALEKIRAHRDKYAAVLMDVQMPEMDGLEATRIIRKEEEAEGLPRLPIIAMTAHALSGDRERCLAAGMDQYLSKPFKPEELARRLADAIPTPKQKESDPV